MNITPATIKKIARDFFPEAAEIRRHIHRNPELSFQEFKTSAFIKNKLREYGIDYKEGFAKTGIVGIIKGRNPNKKTIALRAEMDALPIREINESAYKSEKDGVMHACGHDIHTASLLGTAKILFALKENFEGTVLLVFQPGEETLPGGAKAMLEDGALKNPKPDMVIGQHVIPKLEAGKAGFKAGKFMASVDNIHIRVMGKGGHAAMPHQLTDSVLIASHIIIALQQISSRRADASVPVVLSFGKVTANGSSNVIPSVVEIEGTFRTFNEKWRKEAHMLIHDICNSMAEGMGGHCEVNIMQGYPCLVNDESVTRKSKEYAKEILGSSNVSDLDVELVSEDFAYFAQKFPSVFYLIGSRGEKDKTTSPLHSPNFDVDEEALYTGMAAMSWITISFLNETET